MALHPNIPTLLNRSSQHNMNFQNIQWGLEEIQHPVAGRKTSPKETRSIDPPPVVQLCCTVDPRTIHSFNKHDLVCTVDLFRLPERPDMRCKWTYFAHDGTFDQNRQPIYALSGTNYPPLEIETCIGNHLLLDTSKETHLLQRQTVAQAVEIPGAMAFAFPVGLPIVFAFPGLGVLQTGQYMLRYTLYNRSINGPPLAKCFGQPFTIFTPACFPGIQPPTVISQMLAQLRVPGFR